MHFAYFLRNLHAVCAVECGRVRTFRDLVSVSCHLVAPWQGKALDAPAKRAKRAKWRNGRNGEIGFGPMSRFERGTNARRKRTQPQGREPVAALACT